MLEAVIIRDELTLIALAPTLPSNSVIRFVLDDGADDFFVRGDCYAERGRGNGGMADGQEITAIEIGNVFEGQTYSRLCFCGRTSGARELRECGL
jgi:hypothetical protein